jgi:glycosyltransferase involved in cell wall biosynthesis
VKGSSSLVDISFVGKYYNRQGGISACMASLADGMSSENDVALWCGEFLDLPEPMPQNLTAHLVDMRRSRRWSLVEAVSFGRGLAKSGRFAQSAVHRLTHAHGAVLERADVMTAHSVHAAWIAKIRARGGTTKVLSRLGVRHSAELLWEQRCIAGARHLVAISEAVAGELREHYAVPRERISVIHNGVDVRRFAPSGSVGPRSADLRLVFVGYEFDRKGLGAALRAVAASRHASSLTVVGGANPARYRTLASELGLSSDAVKFAGHQSDVVPILQESDALIFPTKYEPFGLVILEALACGLPVITTAAAGAAEVIGEASLRRLLVDDPNSIEQLKERIDLLGDAQSNEWSALRLAARATAESASWTARVRQHLDLYGELVNV